MLVRFRPEQRDELEAWIARQPEPRPSRPEAVRQLVQNALADGGPKGPHTVEEKIATVEEVIEKTQIPAEPSPAKGLAILKRGKAEAALAALKAKKRKRAP